MRKHSNYARGTARPRAFTRDGLMIRELMSRTVGWLIRTNDPALYSLVLETAPVHASSRRITSSILRLLAVFLVSPAVRESARRALPLSDFVFAPRSDSAANFKLDHQQLREITHETGAFPSAVRYPRRARFSKGYHVRLFAGRFCNLCREKRASVLFIMF